MPLTQTARRLGLGRLAYLLWHLPRGAVKRSAAAGGPFAQWQDSRGAAAMARAAAGLPRATTELTNARPHLHFLTGKKFWYQTAFCLHTLQHHAGESFRVVIHDDGSLDRAAIERLETLFPNAEMRSRKDSDARVAELLPPSRYPFLHAERARPYPNFLKLTDVHAGQRDWRLVLDSDMLFFRRPAVLLDWLTNPKGPLWMADVAETYGYPLETMARVAGAPIPRSVNVGFCGINSSDVDWDQLEHWTKSLVGQHGSSYYLEQALSAMWFAGRPGTVLPAADYIVFPSEDECRQPRAVLHHYVAGSKRGYFRHAWRVALAPAATAANPRATNP
jgi:hypothetical protein